MWAVLVLALFAIAQAQNPCLGNDCGDNSVCILHEKGYRCECKDGYLSDNTPRNGKNCQCLTFKLNFKNNLEKQRFLWILSCYFFSFVIDHIISSAINLCKREHNTCGQNSNCTQTGPREVNCDCNAGYTSRSGDGRNCVWQNACSKDNGLCGENSICRDVQPGQVSFTNFSR